MTASTDKRHSRYVQGGDTIVYPNRLGWWERRVFEKDDDDIFMTIDLRYDRRPDLLAFEMYGNAQLAWLVLQYNNIVDINEEFVAGSEIRIPTAERVTLVMLNRTPGGIDYTEDT